MKTYHSWFGCLYVTLILLIVTIIESVPQDYSYMLCSLFSPLLKQKIWAIQDGTAVIVGGKTNRAKGEFPEEMNRLLDRVPELVNSSLSRQSDSIVG